MNGCAPPLLCRVLARRSPYVFVLSRGSLWVSAHSGLPAKLLERLSTRLSAAIAISLFSIAGCGFHLRGDATYTFRTIFVNGTGAPTLAAELRRALAATGSAQIATDAKDAQVILDIPVVADDKEVLTLSGAGSVREYLLIKRVQFRLHDSDGNEWLPPGEISLRRTYSFSESEVLARDTQEQRLLKEMQTDAVQQIVRRLQAAKKPA